MNELKDLKERLLQLISICEKEIAENMQELNKDFVYRFPWVAESTFKNHVKIKHAKLILDGIEENVTKENITKYLLRSVLTTTLMDRSTSQIHSLISLWEKEAIISFMETFNLLPKLY